MHALAAISGCLLLAITLVDAFCTVVLARRTDRMLRIAGLFYRWTWPPYRAAAKHIREGNKREDYLSVYGPMSFLTLLAGWAVAIVLAYALLDWAAGLQIGGRSATFADSLYLSGTAVFTAGSADAQNSWSRFLDVAEAGTGISFLGLVISYLPVLYSSHSSREQRILLLDARAGSPPSAGAFLRKHAASPERLQEQLSHWEKWCAELIQEHLAYPMLAYFRSQHSNQSWLAAIVAVVDSSAVAMLCSSGDLQAQAEFTFAIGNHVLGDLARVFKAEPCPGERLPERDFHRLKGIWEEAAGGNAARPLDQARLAKLRGMYEPQARALGEYFLIALPSWLPDEQDRANWETAGTLHHKEPEAVSDPFSKR
jgi:hypothetical protein